MAASSNGRVTMAVLGQRVKELVTAINRQDEILEKILEKVNENEKNVALLAKSNEQMKENMEKGIGANSAAILALNKRMTIWNGGNSIFGGVAIVIAALFGNK